MSQIPTTAFWFLRHGETDWNLEGRSQGSIDIPLNATGLAQADAAAASLRGRGVASIVSSPQSRARVTAETVARALDLPVAFEPDLREVNFGVHEGTIQAAAWFTDWIAGIATPTGAEPFAALRTRAAAALTAALQRPAPVLVVAHGAWFRAIRAEMGLDIDQRTPNAMPLFCDPGPPWSLTPAQRLEVRSMP